MVGRGAHWLNSKSSREFGEIGLFLAGRRPTLATSCLCIWVRGVEEERGLLTHPTARAGLPNGPETGAVSKESILFFLKSFQRLLLFLLWWYEHTADLFYLPSFLLIQSSSTDFILFSSPAAAAAREKKAFNGCHRERRIPRRTPRASTSLFNIQFTAKISGERPKNVLPPPLRIGN